MNANIQIQSQSDPDRPLVRLGHIHLKVRNARRSAKFYCDMFNLRITEQVGEHFIFLSSDSSHHQLALQSVGESSTVPAANMVGLYHSAWEVESSQSLVEVWDRLISAGCRVAAVDHGISWALYFDDPDSNGVEVYLDRRLAHNGSTTWQGQSRVLVRNRIEHTAG